jgi:hypothetical protein
MSDQPPSIDGCYWVHAHLLAGGYPQARNQRRLRRRLRSILRAGVTFFLDLTEPGEKGLQPYAPILHELAQAASRPVEYTHLPIPDFDTPSIDHMREILDTLDAALDAGHTVFVHCHAGVGRTGTVVGCYLVRRGWHPRLALSEIVRLRSEIDPWESPSPVTEEQRQMVQDWVG